MKNKTDSEWCRCQNHSHQNCQQPANNTTTTSTTTFTHFILLFTIAITFIITRKLSWFSPSHMGNTFITNLPMHKLFLLDFKLTQSTISHLPKRVNPYFDHIASPQFIPFPYSSPTTTNSS